MTIKVDTETIMESKSIPDNALFLCIRPRQRDASESQMEWEKVRKLLKLPDARRLVEYGEFMLYLICANANPPIDIVKTIFSIAPHQAFYQDHLLGHTALHNACLYGSIQVMTFLIDVAPELALLGRHTLPLHKMISCRNNNAKKIEKLLQINPYLARVKDKMGLTPIDIFFRTWNTNEKQSRSWWQMTSPNTNEDDIFVHRLNYEEFISTRAGNNAIKTFFLLLNAFTNGNVDNDERKMSWLPIHEAIKMKQIPSNFVLYLLRKFPEEMYKQDEYGNFLLHIALTEKHLEPRVIEYLIQTNPRTCQRVNKEGRLPLALAIEYGNVWESNGILQQLLRAYPDALSNPDIQTQLYPFMTALSSEKASTSLVYELLRMDPSLVSIGIPFQVVRHDITIK